MNPPTFYIGFDDPCFDDFTSAYKGQPKAQIAEQLTVDLYVFVSTESEAPVYVRVDMEKGKRLSKALQPDNVDTQGTVISSQIAVFGGAFGFIGGDPVGMLQSVQNMATSGQVNVPINPGMRDFMGKFAWANFGFMTPPPEFLSSALIPDENRAASTKAKRRNLAIAAGEPPAEDPDEKPASDLPDPNESGNAGFLRKMEVSADEYYVGLVAGVIITPIITAIVYVPVGGQVTTGKNAMRNLVLDKQEMCRRIKSLNNFIPEFEKVLKGLPTWSIPAQYGLDTLLMTMFMLMNMGLMQASLLGFFEPSAFTTKMASLVTFVVFPCGYIVYLWISLKGAMVPTSKERLIALKIGSIPAAMEPEHLVFVYSVPPELREKIVIEPPIIPEGAGPDEIKQIMEKHAQTTKEMMQQKSEQVRALGPAALLETGKWKATSTAAEGWLNRWGGVMSGYGPNGYIMVVQAKSKRLLTISTMCILSTHPSLGSLQVKLLCALNTFELILNIYFQPYRQRVKNFEVIATMATAALQMLAPILLLSGYIEDQWAAMVMMLLNVMSVWIGMGKDFASSIVPLIQIIKATSLNMYLTISTLVIGILVAAKKVKSMVKKVRIVPPPPVWTIIRTPPPILELMDQVMSEETMNYVSDVGGQAKKMITAYAKTFAKYSKRWAEGEGKEELDKQFNLVIAGKKNKVDVTKHIKQFHRKACVRAFREAQPLLKDVAQKLYDAATKEAKIVSEIKRAIKSGDDPIAAANSIVSPDLIQKITDLMGPFGPTIQAVAKKAIEGQIAWLKQKGQAKIDKKMRELNDMAAGDSDVVAMKEKLPPIQLSLSTDFNKIPSLDAFKKEFAADIAAAISLPPEAVDRIAIKDVVSGSTKVSFTFTPGDPPPKELLKGVMDLFKKSPKKLPGMLKMLMPTIPVITAAPKVQKSGMDAALGKVIDDDMIEKLKVELTSVRGFIQAYEEKATQAKNEWIDNEARPALAAADKKGKVGPNILMFC